MPSKFLGIYSKIGEVILYCRCKMIQHLRGTVLNRAHITLLVFDIGPRNMSGGDMPLL